LPAAVKLGFSGCRIHLWRKGQRKKKRLENVRSRSNTFGILKQGNKAKVPRGNISEGKGHRRRGGSGSRLFSFFGLGRNDRLPRSRKNKGASEPSTYFWGGKSNHQRKTGRGGGKGRKLLLASLLGHGEKGGENMEGKGLLTTRWNKPACVARHCHYISTRKVGGKKTNMPPVSRRFERVLKKEGRGGKNNHST